jgi:hypothetical protein
LARNRCFGVNVRSPVEDGDPYAAKNMEKWDDELLVACRRYPNMRVYDWASDVKTPGSSKTESTSPHPITPPAAS